MLVGSKGAFLRGLVHCHAASDGNLQLAQYIIFVRQVHRRSKIRMTFSRDSYATRARTGSGGRSRCGARHGCAGFQLRRVGRRREFGEPVRAGALLFTRPGGVCVCVCV